MAERAQALGGHFELMARAAGGTLLRLQLPVAAPGAAEVATQVATEGAA
jgi:nitrate/nitrite-specific signal transduction histidine kinase